MKMGKFPLTAQGMRTELCALLDSMRDGGSAVGCECERTLCVTADVLADPSFLSPATYEPLREAFAEGRLALFPFDPLLASSDEELLLAALFASARIAEAFGAHPTAPYLFGTPESPALLELFSHFGYEHICVLTDVPRSDEGRTTPDGSPITLCFVPYSIAKGRVMFALPAEESLADPTSTEMVPDILPLFSPLPREENARRLAEEKARLARRLFVSTAPLAAAVQMAGLSAEPYFALATKAASLGGASSCGILAAVREELKNAESVLMERVLSSLPANSDAWGELLLFNPLSYPVCRTARAWVTLPEGIRTRVAAEGGISLADEKGDRLPFEILSLAPRLDGRYAAELRFGAVSIPPLSFFRVFLRSEHTGAPKTPKKAGSLLENRHYRIELVGEDLLLTVKATGEILKNPFFLEEQGSSALGGFRPAAEGSLLAYPVSDVAASACTDDSALPPALSLSFMMEIPVSYDFERDERSITEAPLSLCLSLSFAGDDGELLRLSYTLDDPAAHHRLRLAVRTGRIPTRVLLAEGRHVAELPLGVLPLAELYASYETDSCFAAYPKEMCGAEWVNDTLYLNLLIADTARGGIQTGELFLTFGKSATRAVLLSRADDIAGEPLVFFSESRGSSALTFAPEKSSLAFESGTPCVANTLFAPNRLQSLSWTGGSILLAAAKPAEDRRGAILRFFCAGEKEATLSVHADARFSLTDLRELAELPLGDTDVRLRISPHGCLSLRLLPLSGFSTEE